MTARTYGWRPDVPDHRDRVHRPTYDAAALPAHVDNSTVMPACWDQGSLGSCTSFSGNAGVVYERALLGEVFEPSFLHTYYCTRALEGATHDDAGGYIRDMCKVLAQIGVAPASAWPYDEHKFAKRPPKSVYRAALDTRVTSYMRVSQTKNDIRAVLAAGDTIVFGFSVYESFESAEVARTGIVPMPKPHESMLGGHAVLGAGYDPRGVLARNSWGGDWGRGGYFWLPWEYVVDPNLADDFWTLKTVTP